MANIIGGFNLLGNSARGELKRGEASLT